MRLGWREVLSFIVTLFLKIIIRSKLNIKNNDLMCIVLLFINIMYFNFVSFNNMKNVCNFRCNKVGC